VVRQLGGLRLYGLALSVAAIAVSGIAALYEERQRPKVMVLGNRA
jgi:hypothetical protein